jgi:hypothetical protein
MGQEQPIPLDVPPGMVLTQSPLASKGRWTGGQWVRFVNNRPQKIGGYVKLSTTGCVGIPRGAWSWNDLTARQLIAFGTEIKLYEMDDTDFISFDITPWINSATLANPLRTANGSKNVNVNWPSHGASVVGQYIDIANATAIGGIPAGNINGSWPITAIVDNNNVTITLAVAANATATGGGAAVSLGLELIPGLANPSAGFGWGVGVWGAEAWGTPRSLASVSFQITYWTFGNFGKILIASVFKGGLFFFDPTAAPLLRAAQIPTAPTFSSACLVTSEEIVIALGSNLVGTTHGTSTDQNLLQWWASAQGDYTNWDVTATSGPNGSPSVSGNLAQGTQIIAGADLGVHVALIWTDTALYEFQYTGSQFVFNVLLSGTECGLIGPMAYALVGTEAYWLGPQGFFMFNGGVQRIPNHDDVSEFVLSNILAHYTVKTVSWYNQRYNEVWFVFVPQDAQEPTTYVAVNRDNWTWTQGLIPNADAAFTCETKLSGYDARPVVFAMDGNLYQMDNGLDADGQDNPWEIHLDGFELGNGENSVEVSGIAMDMQRQSGNITITIEMTDRTPGAKTIIDSGQAVVAPADNMGDFRLAGRQAAISFSGDGVGCDMRMGIPKVLLTKAGTRR